MESITIMHKTKLWAFSLSALLALLPLIQGCGNDNEESVTPVDLRYRVDQDAYTVDKDGMEKVSFLVKSSTTWEVFGESKADWYTISPATGEAGETYTVTISCKANTELDDRMETINIKSDYWTGKRFTITQKGTAYLNVENVEMIDQEGTASTFNVKSNQKWTAEVTDGDVWLSIKSGTSGEADGTITVSATPNTGEQRTGIVTIYDRYGEIAQKVKCTQDGVVLTPDTPENGAYFVMYEEKQRLTIHVESNTEWMVSKENPQDDTWYSFENDLDSFDGSADLIINVDENEGSNVRTGIILLSTKADEGATPLVRTIKIKQANPRRPVSHDGQVVSGDLYGPGSLMPGIYNFYVEPFGDTQINIFFIWNGDPYAELRYHILNKKTQLSTTPWCSDVFNENSACTVSVNTAQVNVFTLDIQEIETETGVWIYTEWILNGQLIAKAISDGANDTTGASDNWKVPFSNAQNGGNFLFRATGGSATLTKWEYIAPLAWGD